MKNHSPDQIKALKAMWNRRGLKLTHQRLEIFKVMESAEDHPSAEELYERVKSKLPTISFDTVYRTLALLERHGMIARIYNLDNRMRYDSNMDRHYHLICTRCRKINDFYWPELDHLSMPGETEGWGMIEGRHVELRGICQNCLKKERHGK
jgi:Fur family peroxide stress response transcriptional regulator